MAATGLKFTRDRADFLPGGPARGQPLGESDESVRTAGVVVVECGALPPDVNARTEQELLLSEERRRLREIEVIGRSGSWEVDLLTDAVTWSDGLFQLRGLDRADFTGDWAAALRLVHAEDRAQVRAALDACADTGAPMYVRYRIIRANDGELRWVDARGKPIYRDGRLVGMAGTVADVTEDVLAKEEALVAHAFQRAIISASPDIIFVYDLASRSTVWSNRSLIELLGYESGVPLALNDDFLESLIRDDDRAQFDEALAATLRAADQQVIQLNFRLRAVDGQDRWFSRRTTPLRRDEQGAVVELVGVLRDITDAIAVEKRLQHSALHDNLTGLPNRALLMDRIEGALARSARDGQEISVLFCDLDGFKLVNDTGGHAAGDAVLLETARRLQSVLRAGDTVARVGGDEFVVIVEPWNRIETSARAGNAPDTDRELGLHVAKRIAKALRAPVEFNGIEHVVTASIGITYCNPAFRGDVRTITAEEVLQDADAAMYRAKSRGKDCFNVFEHGMRTEVAERGRIEQVLRVALRSDGQCVADAPRGAVDTLAAAYQPIFESGTGILVGFEALARLTDADGRNVAPDVFIPIAEGTGLIRPLGTHMLELACRQLATWRSRTPGLAHVTVAVNISAAQAGNPRLGDEVRKALSTHGLAPSDLVLELTETALLHAAHSTIGTLQTLRGEGVGIAIDDFGVGYASLRYLATLPVSAVKIDRSITAGLPGDETSRKMVSAAAGLAADMGLGCVVEGVETAAQLGALPLGVQLQGYLTGRPQFPADIDLATLVCRR